MGHFWHIETGALRLACFGLAVMMLWLLWLRVADLRSGRLLGKTESPVRSLEPMLLMIVSGLFGGMIFITTAATIIGRFPAWLIDPQPVQLHIMHLPLAIIECILIDRLAYHPAAKWRWCAGWVALAHAVQWGGFIFGMR